MKLANSSLAFGCVALFVLGISGLSGSARVATAVEAAPLQGSESFVYADFETANNGRPVSNHGGYIQLTSYQESPSNRVSFKGMPDPNKDAPEIVRTSKDNQNKAIAFDFQLVGPNAYAGVGVQVHGQPDKDGKPATDDVSAYKDLSMQVFETGVPSLRVEFISNGNGITTNAFPQTTIRIQPGFNTYKIPLKSLLQPAWVDTHVKNSDVLKKLTSVTITATCGPCTPVTGKVVIDNLVFEK